MYYCYFCIYVFNTLAIVTRMHENEVLTFFDDKFKISGKKPVDPQRDGPQLLIAAHRRGVFPLGVTRDELVVENKVCYIRRTGRY